MKVLSFVLTLHSARHSQNSHSGYQELVFGASVLIYLFMWTCSLAAMRPDRKLLWRGRLLGGSWMVLFPCGGLS